MVSVMQRGSTIRSVACYWVLVCVGCKSDTSVEMQVEDGMQVEREPAERSSGEPGEARASRDVASSGPSLVEVDPWLPGPASPTRAFDPERARLEHECRACHPAQAHEWAASHHAAAWTGEAFARAFRVEPLPFCQGCHAPETSPHEPVPSEAAEIGVGCVTCHVAPGTDAVWARSEVDGSKPQRDAPHSILRSPAFAGPAACAGCHEFDFPDSSLRLSPLRMQSTITEHASSRHRHRSCADCHMPVVDDDAGRHRSHRFPGADDPIMLSRSLLIDAERVDAERVRLTLRPGEVGHAVPTGDLLRRLEVGLVEVDSSGHERVLDRRWLQREFADRPHHQGTMLREELRDTRVGVGDTPQREVILHIPPDADEDVLRWRVLHQRVAHGGSDPRRVAVGVQLEVARGFVPRT